MRATLVLLLGLAFTGGCKKPAVTSFVDQPFPENLSSWHLFTGVKPKLQANQGVLPYDLNTPLFSDYASKYRFVWMPPGKSAQYREDGVFDFPIGTILAKTFAFPTTGSGNERLVETRLLVRGKAGWVGLPYVWNREQTDAKLDLAADPVPISFVDASGKKNEFTYFIPNANECKQCHDNSRVMLPIGPKARNLNKDYPYTGGPSNQLVMWAKMGYLQGAPGPGLAPKAAVWNETGHSSLAARAQAYLDNNCGHCHQPGGTAGYTGVDLRSTASGLRALGLCKSPNSAGRVGGLTYDLVPGKPDESILVARMESTRPKEMMPQIGRSTVHQEGVALIREWVGSLPADGAECADEKTHP
ncbi:MAG TPA: SO2930 family diheme c-type cytochrome [Candidatus Angelobacter sp.]|nr:SO2930 family diheme c-type cytochrome [Candidatus Angelobacter sp.]